jgi:hypothetical protein
MKANLLVILLLAAIGVSTAGFAVTTQTNKAVNEKQALESR